ncbi:tetratricopeptide repeat protein [Streptomyces sp. M19]
MYVAVLGARERSMGPDHPDTLRCRHNFAFNLARLGRLEDAYRTARDVASARARVLGADHPDTLVTAYEVAYALGQLGRWDEALLWYQEVAAARGRALGPDHPDTSRRATRSASASAGSAAPPRRWRSTAPWSRTVRACRGPPTRRPCGPGTASA